MYGDNVGDNNPKLILYSYLMDIKGCNSENKDNECTITFISHFNSEINSHRKNNNKNDLSKGFKFNKRKNEQYNLP